MTGPPNLADVIAAADLPAPPAGPTTFAAPWQAQVFALTVSLHDAGLFTWPEWAAALGRRIADGSPAVADPGEDYYRRWVAALIDLLDATGVADHAAVDALEAAWRAAAARTPHGRPIVLD